jgi:hypothetical protein
MYATRARGLRRIISAISSLLHTSAIPLPYDERTRVHTPRSSSFEQPEAFATFIRGIRGNYTVWEFGDGGQTLPHSYTSFVRVFILCGTTCSPLGGRALHE